MTEAAMESTDAGKGNGRLSLLFGLAAGLAAAGGGFYATRQGLISLPLTSTAAPGSHGVASDFAFVPMTPLVVSLSPGSGSRHLRFAAQLEVAAAHEAEVRSLLPRVVDVLNGYLRAVAPAELEAPAALVRLRAQMLRRVQIVTGEDRVRDLLVMEFVLN